MDPASVEAAIAQQVGEILNEIMPALQPPKPEDPLVEIRKKELENDTAELERKTMNDQKDYEIDQAKLQLEREPKKLPSLEINKDVKDLFDFSFEDFKIKEYDPHPAISAPIAV